MLCATNARGDGFCKFKPGKYVVQTSNEYVPLVWENNSTTFRPSIKIKEVVGTKTISPQAANRWEDCHARAIEKFPPKTESDFTRWVFVKSNIPDIHGDVDITSTKIPTTYPAPLAKHQGCVMYLADETGKPTDTEQHPFTFIDDNQEKDAVDHTNGDGLEPQPTKSPVENNSESFTTNDSAMDEGEKSQIMEYTATKIKFIPAVVAAKKDEDHPEKTNEELTRKCKQLANATLTELYYGKKPTAEYTKIHWEVELPWATNARGWITPNSKMQSKINAK